MENNRFGIPENVLANIRARDKLCVYCHKTMIYPCERIYSAIAPVVNCNIDDTLPALVCTAPQCDRS